MRLITGHRYLYMYSKKKKKKKSGYNESCVLPWWKVKPESPDWSRELGKLVSVHWLTCVVMTRLPALQTFTKKCIRTNLMIMMFTHNYRHVTLSPAVSFVHSFSKFPRWCNSLHVHRIRGWRNFFDLIKSCRVCFTTLSLHLIPYKASLIFLFYFVLLFFYQIIFPLLLDTHLQFMW